MKRGTNAVSVQRMTGSSRTSAYPNPFRPQRLKRSAIEDETRSAPIWITEQNIGHNLRLTRISWPESSSLKSNSGNEGSMCSQNSLRHRGGVDLKTRGLFGERLSHGF